MEDQKINTQTCAEAVAQVLFIGALSDANTIFEKFGNTEGKGQAGHIFTELLFFYINLADRLAFQYATKDRDEIMTKVTASVLVQYLDGVKSTGIPEELSYSVFNDTYKERQIEYGSLKMDFKNIGLKENLFWIFENRIAEILGSKDVLTITSIHMLLIPMVGKFLKVCTDLLQGTSKS
jgi:hypothetical protein